MARFDFVQECLIKTWETCNVTVEADSLEEAKEIIKSHGKNRYCVGDDRMLIEDSEISYNSITLVKPEENGGRATNKWFVDGETDYFLTNGTE